MPMDRDSALNLLNANLKNKNLFKHCLACEAVLGALARRLGRSPRRQGRLDRRIEVVLESRPAREPLPDEPHRDDGNKPHGGHTSCTPRSAPPDVINQPLEPAARLSPGTSTRDYRRCAAGAGEAGLARRPQVGVRGGDDRGSFRLDTSQQPHLRRDSRGN